MEKQTEYLQLAKKTTALYLLTHNMGITGFLKELTPPELIGLREFLIEQAIDLTDLLSKNTIVREDLLGLMTPIQSYFMSQDCREPLHSCQNDTCFELEPKCFKKKLYGQIGVVYEYLREQISQDKESTSSEAGTAEPEEPENQKIEN